MRLIRMTLLRRVGPWIVLFLLPLHAAEPGWHWVELRLLPDGSHRLHLSSIPNAATNPSAAFRVPTASVWPSGLIPIFEVKRETHYELRRLPPAGRENTTDPLFFARAPAWDPEAARLAGRWLIQATNVHGGKHWTFFELTAESGRVAGRFDQNTDYRYAFLTGGHWLTNRLRLEVEYIQDRYELVATWRDGALIGTWRQPDDSEHGTWTGTRPQSDAGIAVSTNTVPLWEWRRSADGARRYRLDTHPPAAGWERTAEPLCEVWLP